MPRAFVMLAWVAALLVHSLWMAPEVDAWACFSDQECIDFYGCGSTYCNFPGGLCQNTTCSR